VQLSPQVVCTQVVKENLISANQTMFTGTTDVIEGEGSRGGEKHEGML